ncbi:glycoside hydrolase family 99-like domain-containing protein [Compostibacter hankyongensis]|uniref:Uncharacterized protein n=1 Tax=Compostibacter hankyongensis TaxID=1007089 RepID=A0ABP8FNH8_9BACT
MKYPYKTMLHGLVVLTGLWTGMAPLKTTAQQAIPAQTPPRILAFAGEQPMTRAERPFALSATILNPAKTTVRFTVKLLVPEHLRVLDTAARQVVIAPEGKATFRWKLMADKALYGQVRLEVVQDDAVFSTAALPLRFLPAMRRTPGNDIPAPVKRDEKLLVGAHYFPGWEKGRPEMWSQLIKHPERTPALGFYDQGIPEVADWETKWAVDHGVDFFIYCWYRTSQGGPVEQMLGSAIAARNKSRFRNQMKYTIMWENQNRGRAGVANETDLMKNLLPFWINNYFKGENYLKIDNKPVLFIYRPEFLVDDLGGEAQVRAAFAKMREACKQAGFDGLWLLGEYRGLDAKHLELMKRLGLDYTFAYCWYVPNSPDPQQAIDSQLVSIHKTQELNILPQVVTVSQAWSGWRDEGSIWAIPPVAFETLLRRAKAFVETLPRNQLSGQMLLLDNWNEWGEGHYIEPCTEYGFGYLDAIRKVFLNAPDKHTDLIPEDLGRSSYETAYRQWLSDKRENENPVNSGSK